MTAEALRREVENLVTELYNVGLAIDSTAVVIEGGKGGSGCVTYPRAVSTSALIGLDGRLEEYQYALRERLFTAAFIDGALLQISVRLKGDEVVWHRLGFLACPVAFDGEETAEVSIDEFISALDADTLRTRIRLRAALRFDFDPDAASEEHPETHCTVLSSSCRVPVLSPLSVGHFIRFILRHFYKDHLTTSLSLKKWPCGARRPGSRSPASDELFLDWRAPGVV